MNAHRIALRAIAEQVESEHRRTHGQDAQALARVHAALLAAINAGDEYEPPEDEPELQSQAELDERRDATVQLGVLRRTLDDALGHRARGIAEVFGGRTPRDDVETVAEVRELVALRTTLARTRDDAAAVIAERNRLHDLRALIVEALGYEGGTEPDDAELVRQIEGLRRTEREADRHDCGYAELQGFRRRMRVALSISANAQDDRMISRAGTAVALAEQGDRLHRALAVLVGRAPSAEVDLEVLLADAAAVEHTPERLADALQYMNPTAATRED